MKEVRESLQKIAKSKKFPHALLFSGPKGTGKTSAARIFAKLVNCQNPKNNEPCNQCSSCSQINNGSSLDLIEIDAASNRGIDDIRDLREKIKLAPSQLKYKVYIIDEVHMLTTEAFNALLKTLEEPPPHALFVLCTTEPEKLPETIISRCLRVNFRKANKEEILKALKRVVEGEKLNVEKGVLEAIAAEVDGSFRDAHKILEQLSLTGKKISLKDTKEILEQNETFSPEKLLSLILKEDTKQALKEVEKIIEKGGDINLYLLRILNLLRLGLLNKVGLEEEEEKIPQVIRNLNISQIKSLISLFSETVNEIKICPLPQLPLEVAIVEWIEKRKKGKKNNSLSSAKLEDQNTQNDSISSLGIVEEKWQEILTKIKPKNHSIEALLKASRPIKFQNDLLVLEVFYKFHKERLETPKCRQIIEETVQEVVGIPVRLKCILGEKKSAVNVSTPAAKVTENSEEEVLKLAEEIFNGKII